MRKWKQIYILFLKVLILFISSFTFIVHKISIFGGYHGDIYLIRLYFIVMLVCLLKVLLNKKSMGQLTIPFFI